MGVEDAQRMFLGGNVIPKRQVQLVHVSFSAGDRRDRVVRFAVCFSENKCVGIGIVSPFLKNMICQIDQAFRILVTDSEDRQRPF